MYVHWNKRTERVIIEINEAETKLLVECLYDIDSEMWGVTDEEIGFAERLASNLENLDTSDHWPGI